MIGHNKLNIQCLVILAIQLIFFGCTSPGSVKMDRLEYPLNYLQKVVADALPGGKRMISQNDREFSSVYFLPTKKGFGPAGNSSYRYYAKITVLGDRRPYNIEIIVIKEERNGRRDSGDYSSVGTDKRIARIIQKRIQNILSKRRDDYNIIDDFRVF